MLSPDERRLVESFRRARNIRIVINEGDKSEEVNIFYPVQTEATKRLRSNLRWVMQDYMNAVKREAAQRSENAQ